MTAAAARKKTVPMDQDVARPRNGLVNPSLNPGEATIAPHRGRMDTAKTFLGGTFIGAAGLGALVSLIAPSLALPAAVALRAGTLLEIGGSLLVGAAAVWAAHQKTRGAR